MKIAYIKTTRIAIYLQLIFMLTAISVSAQVPKSIENDLDKLNEQVLTALKIISTKSENAAINSMAEMKPEIKAFSEALKSRINDLPEITDDEVDTFMEKQLSKQLYKDMMALMADASFNQKISQSTALKKEVEELLAFLDLEDEAAEDEEAITEIVSTIQVANLIPNSGTYLVTAVEGEAFGAMDDAGYLLIEINGRSRGYEIMINILVDESKSGKQQWGTEGQIYIQCFDDSGNEILQLQNYHHEGYTIIDKWSSPGGIITGTFKGLFFDDMEQTEDPVPVEGKFTILHVEGSY